MPPNHPSRQELSVAKMDVFVDPEPSNVSEPSKIITVSEDIMIGQADGWAQNGSNQKNWVKVDWALDLDSKIDAEIRYGDKWNLETTPILQDMCWSSRVEPEGWISSGLVEVPACLQISQALSCSLCILVSDDFVNWDWALICENWLFIKTHQAIESQSSCWTTYITCIQTCYICGRIQAWVSLEPHWQTSHPLAWTGEHRVGQITIKQKRQVWPVVWKGGRWGKSMLPYVVPKQGLECGSLKGHAQFGFGMTQIDKLMQTNSSVISSILFKHGTSRKIITNHDRWPIHDRS